MEEVSVIPKEQQDNNHYKVNPSPICSMDLSSPGQSMRHNLVTPGRPLCFVFIISPDPRALELMRFSFFLRRSSPSWSLQCVLSYLESMGGLISATQETLFQYALFLLTVIRLQCHSSWRCRQNRRFCILETPPTCPWHLIPVFLRRTSVRDIVWDLRRC